MIWTIRWSPRCDIDILNMHYRIAERVCKAVVDFATDGSGDVEPVDLDDEGPREATLFRVRARGGFALVRVDEGEMTVHVSCIRPNTSSRLVVSLLGGPRGLPPEASEDR
jgi:hypothetical protein